LRVEGLGCGVHAHALAELLLDELPDAAVARVVYDDYELPLFRV